MKNKNKILFLFIGVTLGITLTLGGVYLFDNEDDHQEEHHELEGQHNDEENNHAQSEAHEEDEEIVKLSDEEIGELGIVLNELSGQKLQQHSDLTGEIVPDPDKLAHIVPRFTGLVIEVNKKIGDRVKKDEVIAVIESNESLVTYNVVSSIDGVVLELHMTPGELIGDEKHIVTIADLNTVWAELNIYQKDLRKIKVGQNAEVYFDEVENAVNSKIFYISPTVDENTRTATARIRLFNKRGLFKPGMFISAKVTTNYLDVEMSVSINAVQNFEGQKVVFVREDEGFKPKVVTVGKSNSKYVEVLSGLELGQSYVAEGAFKIKSELLKESFGGGHGH
jgi:cobalt-zinc-cadmium efflux system membrane fusion protein